MMDPATWVIAAVFVFGFGSWPLKRKAAIAVAANGLFILC
jgi:hypothetical protein